MYLRNNASCPQFHNPSHSRCIHINFFSNMSLVLLRTSLHCTRDAILQNLHKTTVPTQAHANQPNWHHQLVRFQWYQSPYNFQNLKQFSCKTWKATWYYTPNDIHQLQQTNLHQHAIMMSLIDQLASWCNESLLIKLVSALAHIRAHVHTHTHTITLSTPHPCSFPMHTCTYSSSGHTSLPPLHIITLHTTLLTSPTYTSLTCTPLLTVNTATPTAEDLQWMLSSWQQ